MAEKQSFEEALQTLEAAVAQLESGDLSLEESLACFERGVSSAAQCRKRLKQVETKVELLLRGSDGSLRLEEAGDL